jgi:hypothetical protein
VVSGRPAPIRQRDIKQILGAAKKAGAKDVTVRINDVSVIVHLDDDKPPVEEDEVTL